MTSPGNIVPIAAVPTGVEGYGREEGRANARLIAAAPDLFRCAEILAALEHDDNGRSFPAAEDCAFARAALAKAGATS